MRALILCLLLTTSCFAKEYNLCVAAIFQNEGRFMKEWLDYNLLIGVDHFYLYNNESTDNFHEVIDPYVAIGVVELFDWPNRWPETQFAFGCQAYAYQDALKRCKKKTHWLAAIDLDEFIVPLDCFSLPVTLDTWYEHASGVAVHWQCFGTSNVDLIQPHEHMISKLTMKALPQSEINGWYKTIFKVKDVSDILNPHLPIYKSGKNPVNSAGDEIMVNSPIVLQHLQINHYWSRDEYHLKNVKIPRYAKWNTPYEAIMNYAKRMNAVEDTCIHKFLPFLH